MKDVEVIKNNDIAVIDKTDYLYGDNKNTIYVRASNIVNKYNYLAYIIGYNFNLSKEDINVLGLILENKNNDTRLKLRNRYVKLTNKSNMTFERAIKHLTENKIICIDIEDNIIINEKYKIQIDFFNYILIAVKDDNDDNM